MKKLILILLLAPAVTFSQVSIGGHVGASTYFADETHPENEGIGFQIETQAANINAGLDLEIGIGKRFGIRTGIEYMNRDFSGTPFCFYCLSPIDGGGGLFPGILETENVKQHYLEVPLALTFDIIQHNKFRLTGSAGIQAGINFRKSDPEFDFPSYEPYKYSSSVIAGAEVGFKAGKKIELTAGVNYLHGIPISNYYNPNSIGANLGILFNLGKN
ncbi:MAG: hypothetical protein ACI959_001986 [Limisphaerales bacterium]|jgi:hypothetical protein